MYNSLSIILFFDYDILKIHAEFISENYIYSNISPKSKILHFFRYGILKTIYLSKLLWRFNKIIKLDFQFDEWIYQKDEIFFNSCKLFFET